VDFISCSGIEIQWQVCLDPKPLNKAVKRNHFPLPTIDDLLPELYRVQVFAVADVKNGFWHVPLDDESSKLTTFATSWGRFRDGVSV